MNDLKLAGARRIVTFIDQLGQSRIESEKRAPRVINYSETPGLRGSVLWATESTPTLGGDYYDPAPNLKTIHPPTGGSVFMILTVPPDSVYTSEDFNPEKSIAEQMRLMPGIIDRMEPDAPGFHRTDTLDYVIVLTGNVWLVVGGEEVQLHPGDTVIQAGARHAWQNRGESPATLALVLLGAENVVGS